MVEERVQRRLAAILAADVIGYSRLMGEDGPDNTSSYSLEGLARARRLPAKSACTVGSSSWAGKIASNASIC